MTVHGGSPQWLKMKSLGGWGMSFPERTILWNVSEPHQKRSRRVADLVPLLDPGVFEWRRWGVHGGLVTAGATTRDPVVITLGSQPWLKVGLSHPDSTTTLNHPIPDETQTDFGEITNWSHEDLEVMVGFLLTDPDLVLMTTPAWWSDNQWLTIGFSTDPPLPISAPVESRSEVWDDTGSMVVGRIDDLTLSTSQDAGASWFQWRFPAKEKADEFSDGWWRYMNHIIYKPLRDHSVATEPNVPAFIREDLDIAEAHVSDTPVVGTPVDSELDEDNLGVDTPEPHGTVPSSNGLKRVKLIPQRRDEGNVPLGLAYWQARRDNPSLAKQPNLGYLFVPGFMSGAAPRETATALLLARLQAAQSIIPAQFMCEQIRSLYDVDPTLPISQVELLISRYKEDHPFGHAPAPSETQTLVSDGIEAVTQ